MKKAQEKKSDLAEMRMLRLICKVTKLERIRNERIRENETGRNNKESAGGAAVCNE